MAFYALDAGSDARKKADVIKPSRSLGLGNVKNYLKPMKQQITLEEALEQPISCDAAPLHIRPDVEEYIKRFSEKYAQTLQALADH